MVWAGGNFLRGIAVLDAMFRPSFLQLVLVLQEGCCCVGAHLSLSRLCLYRGLARITYRVHGCVLCVCAVLIVFFFNDADRVIVTIGGIVVVSLCAYSQLR